MLGVCVKISNSLGLPIDTISATNPRVRGVANALAAADSVAWLAHHCIVVPDFTTPFTLADLSASIPHRECPLTRSHAATTPSLSTKARIARALGCPEWIVRHDSPWVINFANKDALFGSDAWVAHQFLMAPPPLERQQAVGATRFTLPPAPAPAPAPIRPVLPVPRAPPVPVVGPAPTGDISLNFGSYR